MNALATKKQVEAAVKMVDRKEIAHRASELMQKVRMHIAVYHPFFGALLHRLKPKVDWRHPSCYTDAVVLGFNPEFVVQLEWDALVYITLHEVSHCALRHPFRRGKRDPKLFNQAADHVVNLGLNGDPSLAAMRPRPDSIAGVGLADERFIGMAVEQVYSVLEGEQAQQEQPDDDKQEGEGSQQGMQGATGGAGDCLDAGASGEPLHEEDEEKEAKESKDGKEKQDAGGQGKSRGDPSQSAGDEEETDGGEGDTQSDGDNPDPDGGEPDGDDGEDDRTDEEVEGEEIEGEMSGSPSPSERSQLEREWGEAVMTAALAAGGEMGGVMKRQMDAANAVRATYEEYVDEFAQKCFASVDSWRRPNRRYSDVYLPSRSVPAVSVLVAGVDTSGSITAKDLHRFEQSLQRIQEQFEAAEIVVAYCDTQVRKVERFKRGDTVVLSPEGGGGTHFHPVFKLAKDLEEDGEDIAGVIYLTDLEGHVDGWRKYEDIETLWVSTNPKIDDLIYGAPKFGRICTIHD